MMKIAIFHDFFDKIGGGERLVLELASALNADIITTNLVKGKAEKLGFKGIKIIDLPLLLTISPFKQFAAPLAFSSCDFSEKYDFFILSGSWVVFAAKKHKPNLYYCHTPLRDFYDFKEFYLKKMHPVKSFFCRSIYFDIQTGF